MRRTRNVLFAVLIVAGLWNAVLAQENYSQWTSSRDVILNTKASGANVTATQVNFPVLIRLTASDSAVFTGALVTGADIRFARTSGKHLPFQIEQWNAATKTAAIWVLVDTIKGSDSAASVKMFWGKAGAADSSKGSAVFDTTNGFQAVWHLNEATGATNNDATINAFSGTPTAMTDVAGVIGNAKLFNGTSSVMKTTGTATGKLAFPARGTFTVSAWFNSDTTIGPNYIVSKGQNHYSIYFRSSNAGFAFCEGAGTVRESAEFLPLTGLNKRWVYGVGVRNGASIALYLDGALASNTLKSTNTARNDTFTVMIGKRADGDGTSSFAHSWFSGMIDEAEISNVARSADWIKLSYESQKASASLISFGTVQQASVGEDYATWSNSTPIYLNTKVTGANVATTVTKFPVLVRLNSGNNAIFTAAQTNGQDIRFAKLNGTHLPYQIEQWNSTAKTAAIWVLVDSIKGNDSASYFKMYYGKAGVADSSKGSAVFDTTNGFQAVWHLNEATGAINNEATINAFNGTPTAMTDAAGMIGNCKDFDGSTSYMNTVGTATGKLAFDASSHYTLSAWFYSDIISGGDYIISKGQDHYALYLRSTSPFNLSIAETNTRRESAEVASAGMAGRWVHTVGVRNGASVSLYVDGALATSTMTTANATRSTTPVVQLGRRSSDGTQYFDGKIDEAEISNVARSADWIKLCYQNQKESQVLLNVGAGAPPVYSPATPSLTSPANAATDIALAPTLTWGTVSGAATYRVQLSTISTFVTTVVDDSTLTVGTKAITGLANSIVYYWRVNAKNSTGTSGWAVAYSFTTVPTAPATAPTLSAPANAATGISVTPTLTWGTVAGASNYRIQLSTISTFATTVVDDSTLTAGSKAITPALTVNVTYYWRVNAKNAGGTTAWSTLFSFKTVSTGVIAAKNHYVPATMGHNGVLEVYMANGSRVMEIAYGASATKTQLLNAASKTLARGYYTYRFRGTDAQVTIVGKLVK